MDELKIFFRKTAELLGLKDLIYSEEAFSLLYEKIEKIKNENDMLNITLDNCADNFHVTDGEGNILRVNRAFEIRCNIAREFVEGKTIYDMEKLGVYKPSLSSVAIREKRQFTYLQTVSDGEVVTTATPIMDNDDTVKYVVCNARSIDDLQILNKYYRDKSSEAEINTGQTNVDIISECRKMKELKELANQVAKADSSILITGETGSGKSILAKYIHQNSSRNKGKFIEINCAAIPESLIESELFGYSTGAFTGAKQGGKLGLIELANNGTLFLDEIGDMPLSIQAKLLNVLQERVITRVGGEATIAVNIRIIAATNCDLNKMIANGRFRSELYYRINVIPLYLPPLRERREDILSLIEHFRRKFCYIYKTNVTISKEALDKMQNYNWPGNVREVENLIERLIVIDRKGIIESTDLPNSFLATAGLQEENVTVNRVVPLKEAIEEVEKQLIISTFRDYKSSYKVADKLKISQSAAIRRIHKYILEALE